MGSTGDQALIEREPRRTIAASCYLLRANGEYAPVELRNLSYDGCCVATHGDYQEGEQLSLTVGARGRIDAEVRWADDGLVGLRFSPLERGREMTDRKQPRVSTRCEIQLRKVGHVAYRVDVRDLSPSGCCVDLVSRPRRDDRMLAKFEGLEALDCRVRWVAGFSAGLEFDRPIHPAVFDLLMSRLGG